MRVPFVFANIAVVAFMLSTACSSSEFGGITDQKAKKSEDSGDTGTDGADAGDTSAPQDQGSSGDTLSPDGAAELADRSDSGRGHIADETVEGCKLPDDIAAKVGGGGGESGEGLDLLGWGESSKPPGMPELTNLDLNDCEWFKKNKKEGTIKQVYVFQKKGEQSYVQPVLPGENPVCRPAGRFGGQPIAGVTCAMLPTDSVE